VQLVFADKRPQNWRIKDIKKGSYMDARLFAAVLGLGLVFPMASSSSQAGAVEERTYAAAHLHDRYVVRLFGPQLHYAPVVVKALFDSCWRYRPGRRLDRIWTCGNYVKPNADFDWGYGGSIADQAARYGYPW
jgi:hypothetical protein